MTVKNRTGHVKCPFWTASSMKCSICNDGLFIPLDDHVKIFCESPHFTACKQYTHHSENQISLLENVRKSEENRRKYLRIQTSHAITLVKISGSDKQEPPFSSSANTIDVSKGGMRVATDKPLLYDSVIQFSFDDSLPQSLHGLTGQVKWCHKQLDEPGYQAGVSFQADHIIEAMVRHLGQQHNHR